MLVKKIVDDLTLQLIEVKKRRNFPKYFCKVLDPRFLDLG